MHSIYTAQILKRSKSTSRNITTRFIQMSNGVSGLFQSKQLRCAEIYMHSEMCIRFKYANQKRWEKKKDYLTLYRRG